ncbi:ABC transporter ATP-binding protein [uncultured Anaerococcus sp.]|uniref:ABC transporter ATP-binding protein n=1 Tax=uncultured Anaerococcus sp. TaxID=293428 RepID=UPI00262BDB39|nr:ABC transporter ATP-binding protein [uncultured Anaerococcus sp.]
MLTVKNLNKNFGTHVIYKDLNIDIKSGEIFALIGPNGIGKTTLIRMILGLDSDFDGSINRGKYKIGYSPETPKFPEILTGNEFLDLIKYHHGSDDDINGLMKKVGLDPTNMTKISNYSKGMLQRLAVAQSLIGDPDIILLDEPSSGLDFFGQMAMQDLIKSLKSSDKAILLNSHLLYDVEKISDRGLIIMGSENFKEFSRDDFKEKTLPQIFLNFAKELGYESY